MRACGPCVRHDDQLLQGRQAFEDFVELGGLVDVFAGVAVTGAGDQHFRFDLAETVDHALGCRSPATSRTRSRRGWWWRAWPPGFARCWACTRPPGRRGRHRRHAGCSESRRHARPVRPRSSCSRWPFSATATTATASSRRRSRCSAKFRVAPGNHWALGICGPSTQHRVGLRHGSGCRRSRRWPARSLRAGRCSIGAGRGSRRCAGGGVD